MKKILTLSALTLSLNLVLLPPSSAKSPKVAQCPVSRTGFRVKFAQAHTVVRDQEGLAYGWESKSLPLQSELVWVSSQKTSLKALKAKIQKAMPTGCRVWEERPFRLGQYPGLQLEGLNENGVPFTFRILATAAHGYVYGSTQYDTARNREFVESFSLSP